MENKDQLKQYWTSDDANNNIPDNTLYINDKGVKCIKFVIPVGEKAEKEKAEKEIAEMVYSYREDIICIDDKYIQDWNTDNMTPDQLELIEKCKIMYSHTSADIYKKFIIPVGDSQSKKNTVFQKLKNIFTWKK